MSEDTHALLSPSSSQRWMTCPGSVVMEDGEPDTENEYSKEGTLAHAVAAHCLTNKIVADGVLFLEHQGKTEIVTQEMRDYVQEYLDYVWERAAGHHLLVEQRLELEELTSEKNAYGTADAVVISDEGDLVDVIDFKYGYNKVDAQDNSQLRIYAWAVLRQFEMLGDFKKVRPHIHQPRIKNVDHETVTIAEMAIFEAKVRAAIVRIEEAKKSNSLAGFLHPSEKACKYCKAAYKCPALASQVAQATSVDFEDETQTELITPVDLGAAMSKTDLIEIWLKNVRGKVEAELLSGKPVKGYKLVEGKKGNRDWVDEEDAKAELKKLKLTDDVIFDTSLRSVAQLEKKLKGKTEILDKIKALYRQKMGKPSVAPVSDPRTAYDPKPSEDFSVVE